MSRLLKIMGIVGGICGFALCMSGFGMSDFGSDLPWYAGMLQITGGAVLMFLSGMFISLTEEE